MRHVAVTSGILVCTAIVLRVAAPPPPDVRDTAALVASAESVQVLAARLAGDSNASAGPHDQGALRREGVTLLEHVEDLLRHTGAPPAAHIPLLLLVDQARQAPQDAANDQQSLGAALRALSSTLSALAAQQVLAMEAVHTSRDRAANEALLLLACAVALQVWSVRRAVAARAPLIQRLQEFTRSGMAPTPVDLPGVSGPDSVVVAAWNSLVGQSILAETERRAEAANTAAAQSKAQILERMQQAVLVFTRDGGVTAVNRGASVMFDRRREELLQSNIWSLVPVPAHDALAAMLRTLEIHGAAAGTELQLLRPDGSAMAVELSCGVLVQPESGTSEFFLIAQDVADKVLLREHIQGKVQQLEIKVAARTRELEEERNKLNAFLEQAPDMMFEIDGRKHISWANGAACRELATALPDLCGVSAPSFVGSEDRGRLEEEYARLCEQGQIVTRLELVGSSGKRVPVEVAATLVRGAAGEPTGARLVARSLAERTESERRQQLLLAAMEGTQDGVIISHLDGHIQHANGAAARMSGATPEAMVGKLVAGLSHTRVDGHNVDERHFSQVLIQGFATAESIRWPAPDHSIPVAVNSALIKDLHKVPLAIVTVQRDLSEENARREREVSYRDSLMRSERLSALGQLIAGVAHELNNPLAAVIGFAQLLGLGASPEEAARDLEQLVAAAERCRRIVSNLLTFARRHPAERNPTLLSQVIRDAVALVEYEFRVNNVEVALDLASNEMPLMLDGHQIQQVLINLLKNSEHAIREGAERGVIRITTKFTAEDATVTFEDDGPGIPEAIQGKVFDPFFTTKEVGKGTGLGLSISYGIIQEHGGQIRLGKCSLRGACFVITLPVVEAIANAEPALPMLSLPAPIKGRRVLVVDDEAPIRTVLARMLSLDDHRVDVATNAREALTMLDAAEYDCVLCDQHMPGMTGTEMFQALWARHPHMRTRCILVTGDTVDPEAQAFAQDHGVPFHPKPFDLAALGELVQDVLRANAEPGVRAA